MRNGWWIAAASSFKHASIKTRYPLLPSVENVVERGGHARNLCTGKTGHPLLPLLHRWLRNLHLAPCCMHNILATACAISGSASLTVPIDRQNSRPVLVRPRGGIADRLCSPTSHAGRHYMTSLLPRRRGASTRDSRAVSEGEGEAEEDNSECFITAVDHTELFVACQTSSRLPCTTSQLDLDFIAQ